MKKGLLGLLFLSLVVGVLPSCAKKDKKAKTTTGATTKKTRKHGEKKAKPTKAKPAKKKRVRKTKDTKKINKKDMTNNKGRRYGMEDDTKRPKEELVA